MFNHPSPNTQHLLPSLLGKAGESLSLGEVSYILATPIAGRRNACEHLIMQEIAVQHGKTLGQLNDDANANPNIIGNAIIILIDVSNFDTTLPVVLEVLRQSDDFLTYNNIAPTAEALAPIHSLLYVLCCRNPWALQDFLLDKHATIRGREIAIQSLSAIGATIYDDDNADDLYADMLEVTTTVLDAYIADHSSGQISDRRLLSRIVEVAAVTGLKELYDKIIHLYRMGWIDESIITEEDAYDGLTDGGWKSNPPVLSARDWFLPQPIIIS